LGLAADNAVMVRRNKILVLVLIFLALQFILLARAQAEYRVFILGVTYDSNSGEQEFVTTLDNLQYDAYYKFSPTQKTRIIDHWMCWGPTPYFKPYCDRPAQSPGGTRTP